jgi:hypothetical protein
MVYANMIILLWLFFLFFGYFILKDPPVEIYADSGNCYIYRWFGVALGVVGVIATLKFIGQAGSVGAFMYLVKVEKALVGLYVFRSLLILGAFFFLCSYITSPQGERSFVDSIAIFFLLGCV